MPAPDLDVVRSNLEAGHALFGGRVRTAVTRTGIAVGFPEDPFVHVSWVALGAGAVVVALVRRAR